MSLHVDIPSRAQVDALFARRGPGSVSVYLPTDPVSDGEGERIAYKNAVTEVAGLLVAEGLARGEAEEVADALAELDDAPGFWRTQARTLAVFAAPGFLWAFRLPNVLQPFAGVADRFFLKPLLRALTFPQAAFVLALSQSGARLLEVTPGGPPEPVAVPDMPTDAASFAGRASIADRSPMRRLQGGEGQKVLVRQYARAVDQALRPLLNGMSLPLILAATDPNDAIYRSVSSSPHLAASRIGANPDTTSDQELADLARGVLDEIYAGELMEVRRRFDTLSSQGRATTDLAIAARAATVGAVDTLLVDIDRVVPGEVDEATGAISPVEGPQAHGVADEIARRVWATGGRVLAVRADEVPGGGAVAALLRHPLA